MAGGEPQKPPSVGVFAVPVLERTPTGRLERRQASPTGGGWLVGTTGRPVGARLSRAACRGVEIFPPRGKILPRPLTVAGSQHPILLGSGAAAPVYQRVLDGPFDIRRERKSLYYVKMSYFQ